MVPALLVAAVVAVINRLLAWLLLVFFCSAEAGVLPEDRADVLYHSYDGGGAEISGPSILVRKKFREDVSVTVNHYVDSVSSASIDVISTASPYSEERQENSISVDYLYEKTTMGVGYTLSDESDYEAQTVNVNFSQDFFGDLTTLNLGYALGSNTVGRNGDDSFNEAVDTRSYRMSVSQIVTQDLLLVASMEAITDEGYLNNPYRSVRYLDSSTRGYSYQPEVYPNTRTSTALALRGKYFLPYRAALQLGYRFFSDSWGIRADTFEIGYVHPWQEQWLFELSWQYYDQGQADFYNDLFPYQDAQNFLARDKEMSSFSDQAIGFGVSYEFIQNGAGLIKKGSVNFNIDHIMFDYRNFRDVTVVSAPGEEPLYSFDANVIRFFVSIWF